MKPHEDELLRWREAETLKRFAILGIGLSSIAVLLVVLTMPMLYTHIQQAQSRMYHNLDFCRARSANILKEIGRTQVSVTNLKSQF
jgi:hypothetical protein